MINYTEIAWNSDLYAKSRDFRNQILRQPLGLELSLKDTEGEDTQIHLAIVENDSRILGIIILKPLSSKKVKFRQMAISPSLQGKGVGRNLMKFAEEFARSKGFKAIELSARVYAQGFYEKLGYQTIGEAFIEVTLPTIKMEKSLI